MPPAAKRRKTKAQPRYLCMTCGETRLSKFFPDYNPASECEHLINTCKDCLSSWVEANVDDNTLTILGKGQESRLGVPCIECAAGIMKSVNIEMAVSKKVFERFEELERKHIAESTPGWRWCMAAECRAGQVHVIKPTEEKAKEKSRSSFGMMGDVVNALSTARAPKPTKTPNVCVCQTCGSKACVDCDRPWHEGESCEAYQDRLRGHLGDEDASEKLITGLTKKCPGCKGKIEKDGGCSAMFCTHCRTSFCWHCLETLGDPHGCQCARRNGIEFLREMEELRAGR